MMKAKNGLSFDVEEWFDVTLLDRSKLVGIDLEKNTVVPRFLIKIIKLLDEQKVKATFFVTGKMAKKHSDLIKELAKKGHEVASHGYGHSLIRDCSKRELEKEIALSQESLVRVLGKKVEGFRASVNAPYRDLDFYFKTLKKNGFKYDSSVYPTTFGVFSGQAGFSEKVCEVVPGFFEIPLSCYSVLGKKVPISGGFYIRMMPWWLYGRMLESKRRRGEGVIIYLHSWEIETRYPKVIKHPLRRIIQYGKDESVLAKLRAMLEEFEFTKLSSLIGR